MWLSLADLSYLQQTKTQKKATLVEAPGVSTATQSVEAPECFDSHQAC